MQDETWIQGKIINWLEIDNDTENGTISIQNKDYKYYFYSQAAIKDEEIKNIFRTIKGKPIRENLNTIMLQESSNHHAKPEYTIVIRELKLIIIIETKADVTNHESNDWNMPKEFAIDGSLYYAKHFKNNWNVISISASGSDRKSSDGNSISYHIWTKNSKKPTKLKINGICSFEHLINYYYSNYVEEIHEFTQLIDTAKEINKIFYDSWGIEDSSRANLIAYLLIALNNNQFIKIYNDFEDFNAIREQIKTSVTQDMLRVDIDNKKVNDFVNSMDKLLDNNKINLLKREENSIFSVLRTLEDRVSIHVAKNFSFDIMGTFFNEFMKKSANNGKSLGVVFTPTHITELFVELANVNNKSVILDIACGSGGFLVASLSKMLKMSNTNKEKNKVREQIFGVELLSNVYQLALANMILRGDGKSHIYNSNSLELPENIKNEIEEGKCNVGFINPPYSQKNATELSFTKKMLDLLAPRGIGISIFPLSCISETSDKKSKQYKEKSMLLKKHRLIATMKMPETLFYPVGTNTVICVWEAHTQHDENNDLVWMADWSDDGFEIRKHSGRNDFNNLYKSSIKDKWISEFKQRYIDSENHYSINSLIDAKKSWLPQNYLQTNFSNHSISDVKNKLVDFLAYKFKEDNYEN